MALQPDYKNWVGARNWRSCFFLGRTFFPGFSPFNRFGQTEWDLLFTTSICPLVLCTILWNRTHWELVDVRNFDGNDLVSRRTVASERQQKHFKPEPVLALCFTAFPVFGMVAHGPGLADVFGFCAAFALGF